MSRSLQSMLVMRGSSKRPSSSSCFPVAVTVAYRAQSQPTMEDNAREKRRMQPMADGNNGNQMVFMEAPELDNHLQFSADTLEHVKVPDHDPRSKNRTDIEKDRQMREKFGPYGPGERHTKSIAQTKRDMLQSQQDVDGLPWEVRWKKSLIPTQEEIVQDIRDRFDLFVQDPMEREQEWYLHWKDRGFKIQKDRMIWPQGYTDYLDHYDEHGRRRVLPSDQRWSDTSWKHLADTQYRDRMWLIEGEERKALHHSMQDQRLLIEEEEQRLMETSSMLQGLRAGVVDLHPDQAYEAITGTADPIEVAKTKMKLNAYGTLQAGSMGRADGNDPEKQLPDMEPLPSGLSVEQALAVVTSATVRREKIVQSAQAASSDGKDPVMTYMTELASESKRFNNQPMERAQVEAHVQAIQALQQQQQQQLLEAAAPPVTKRDPSTGAIAEMEGVLPGIIHSEPLQQREGYITCEPRPEGAEPNVPTELYHVPRSEALDEMPEWYRSSLVDTEPLIQSYGIVQDPLEQRCPADSTAYFTQREMSEADRISYDDATMGVSAFDEVKMRKLQKMPELVVGYKPLPLFRQASQDDTDDCNTKGKKRRSEMLRQQRLDKHKAKEPMGYDADLILPSLPWETDAVVDPYRGVVAEDESTVAFVKDAAEKTWRAYRGTFRQALAEFASLTKVVTNDRCEAMLLETIARFQRGDVGGHPEVPTEQLEVYKLVFEAHAKSFLADFYKYNSRVTEANTLKSEGDEALRRASAKSKLLGRAFMNFIQEMTSIELDEVRRNPVQRHAITLHEKKFGVVVKPFGDWIQGELLEFSRSEFQSPEQLEIQIEFLVKRLKNIQSRVPTRVDGIPDATRDRLVDAVYHWCRGTICFFAGKLLHRMYIDYAETRFRSRAEMLFEDSIEYFTCYFTLGSQLIQMPIPDAEPPYEYEEKDFLDGESAVLAEVRGDMEKAEALWHSGTSRRWYPLVDETEYMWFNERRGRVSLALDISDRCLENVNKKTHPSIHPFPEVARVYLEGAPLTQETAEHLWMRYMGDLYWEHAELMSRQGRFQTSRTYMEKSLGFYHTAVRTARERLPPSWHAPLLTEARYLMRAYDIDVTPDNVEAHLVHIDAVVTRLFARKEPRHWKDAYSDMYHRLAVVEANIPAYGASITKKAMDLLGWKPSNELLMQNMQARARGLDTLPELKAYFETVNRVADDVFRKRILAWRAMEMEGSDPYLHWTFLYFSFRVSPSSSEEVQKLWEMFEPAYQHIYTNCALSLRQHGYKWIHSALRALCQILDNGDLSQKKVLREELTKIREHMFFAVDVKELDRTLFALENHLADPAKPTYTYGTAHVHRSATEHKKMLNNTLLRMQLGSKDYEEMQEKMKAARAAGGETVDPRQLVAQSRSATDGLYGEDAEPLGSQPEVPAKQLFQV